MFGEQCLGRGMQAVVATQVAYEVDERRFAGLLQSLAQEKDLFRGITREAVPDSLLNVSDQLTIPAERAFKEAFEGRTFRLRIEHDRSQLRQEVTSIVLGKIA